MLKRLWPTASKIKCKCSIQPFPKVTLSAKFRISLLRPTIVNKVLYFTYMDDNILIYFTDADSDRRCWLNGCFFLYQNLTRNILRTRGSWLTHILFKCVTNEALSTKGSTSPKYKLLHFYQ